MSAASLPGNNLWIQLGPTIIMDTTNYADRKQSIKLLPGLNKPFEFMGLIKQKRR
jgi:hypothetical protein